MQAHDEAARISALRRYEVLELPADGAFDRVAAIAARVFDAPIAAVSIVDEDRIFFLSHLGLDTDVSERHPGLCSSAILRDGITVISDTTLDPVAMTNPLVAGEMGLRFYAAAPIRTFDGHNLGTVSVLDYAPRQISPEQSAILEDLAGLVAHELELRLGARSLIMNELHLRQAAAAKARANELAADALRAALVPQILPVIPGMEVAVLYRPANRSLVGGDFYDVFPVGPRAWGAAVGDVCGKGLNAAVITAAARHALRAAAVEHSSPAAALSVVNAALFTEWDQQQPDEPAFCTAIYARLQRWRDGFRVVVACGGHPPGFLRRADGRVEDIGTPGSLLGGFPQGTFRDSSIYLRGGDAVVFFTDGVTEAPTLSGQFGRQGIAAALRPPRSSAREILDGLDESLRAASSRQRDDIALVVLRVG